MISRSKSTVCVKNMIINIDALGPLVSEIFRVKQTIFCQQRQEVQFHPLEHILSFSVPYLQTTSSAINLQFMHSIRLQYTAREIRTVMSAKETRIPAALVSLASFRRHSAAPIRPGRAAFLARLPAEVKVFNDSRGYGFISAPGHQQDWGGWRQPARGLVCFGICNQIRCLHYSLIGRHLKKVKPVIANPDERVRHETRL